MNIYYMILRLYYFDSLITYRYPSILYHSTQFEYSQIFFLMFSLPFLTWYQNYDILLEKDELIFLVEITVYFILFFHFIFFLLFCQCFDTFLTSLINSSTTYLLSWRNHVFFITFR
ncbi:uncharacterized protein DS421_13g401710 [Arachis hypogaea]|nr:uncharacterized protein DS421_13g401710 [Arachis hypogaea]